MKRRTTSSFPCQGVRKKLAIAGLLISFLVIGLVSPASAALTIDAGGVTHTIDFNDFLGSGFAPTPDPGQLDSGTWATLGMSDGDTDFDMLYTSGDYARGTSSGGVATGGFYSFEIGNTAAINRAFGVQATGTDFTPGAMVLRLENATGAPITQVDISYTIHLLNNGDRSTSFNLGQSSDNKDFLGVEGFEFASPQTADSSAGWAASMMSGSLQNLAIPDGAFHYLRWYSDDVAGSGTRDELALDDLRLTAFAQPVPIPGAALLLGSGLICLVGARRKLRT